MLSTILFSIGEPELACNHVSQRGTILLTILNDVGSKTLFNAVFIRPGQVVHLLLRGEGESRKYFSCTF